MGALHFGLRRTVWLAVGTASLGPSGKKDPGWCGGTLPGASLQTVSLCSFLGYSNCPTFPKGSSGVSQAQQAQCWPPTWLKLYIYISSLAILTTQPEPSPVSIARGAFVPSSGLEHLSSGLPHSPQPRCGLGCVNWGNIRGLLAPSWPIPTGWAWCLCADPVPTAWFDHC